MQICQYFKDRFELGKPSVVCGSGAALVGVWLSPIGYWLLVIGYWTLLWSYRLIALSQHAADFYIVAQKGG